jgi:hypothetical protein
VKGECERKDLAQIVGQHQLLLGLTQGVVLLRFQRLLSKSWFTIFTAKRIAKTGSCFSNFMPPQTGMVRERHLVMVSMVQERGCFLFEPAGFIAKLEPRGFASVHE